MDLADLRREHFELVKGSTFRVVPPEGGSRDLVLAEVEALSRETTAPGGPRTPFSLVFREARDGSHFQQGTVPLHHPDLGSFEMFLVPIGPDAEGMRYQAIFT